MTVADASVAGPDGRPEIPFGTITLTARADDQEPDRRSIIFDPGLGEHGRCPDGTSHPEGATAERGGGA